ncbi:hypothetical protein AB0P05_33030 [Streptomyces flaveolus]|uniref:hypothetical protein n=1 Tax=Streptomyces flaveolus TaxID=67297 RepID=UPI0034407027
MQINFEAGSRRIKEQDAWAQGVFPAAHERLKQAAAAMPPGTPAQPFIDALTELDQAQADTDGFVVLYRWAQILERHFRPQLSDPNRNHGIVPPLRRPRLGAVSGPTPPTLSRVEHVWLGLLSITFMNAGPLP